MSEYSLHVAICDDCASLALYSPAICKPFKQAITKYPEALHLGATTRAMSASAVLAEARRLWPDHRAGEKLACALGRLTHLAADAVFKPIFRQFGEEVGAGSMASMYEDLFAYRAVYAEGRRSPFAAGALHPGCASLAAATVLNVAELEEVFTDACRRQMARQHKSLGGQNWLEAAQEVWQDDRIDLPRYCAHYVQPRPELEHKYLTAINFYNAEDEIIRLVRSVQSGKPAAEIDLEQAVAAAPRQSHWARAVAQGYQNILAASRQFARPSGTKKAGAASS